MATELIGKIDTPAPKARMPDCLHATAKNGPTFVGSCRSDVSIEIINEGNEFYINDI